MFAFHSSDGLCGLSSFFERRYQYGVHTRKIKGAKEVFRIWFSAEAAKRGGGGVKINKMALHTSVNNKCQNDKLI